MSVAVLAPSGEHAAAVGEAVMVMRRMDMGELRLSVPETGAADDFLASADTPPGTVMVSVGAAATAELSQNLMAFPLDLR